MIQATKDSTEDVIMAIDFPVNKSVDVVYLTTILTVDDFRSYDFIEKIEDIKQVFKTNLIIAIQFKFVPHDALFGNQSCLTLLPENQQVCVANSHYDLDWIQEVNKQSCMIEANYEAYLAYSILIKNKAFNGQVLKDDFKEILLSTFNEINTKYP